MTLKEAKTELKLNLTEYRELRKQAKKVAKLNGEKLKNVKVEKQGDIIAIFVKPPYVKPYIETNIKPITANWNGDGFDIEVCGSLLQ